MEPTLQSRLAARQPDGRAPHVMNQSWVDLLFLHWRFSATEIQKTLPPGLYVDTYEGDAFLGVVPFLMRNIRPRFTCSVPWISHFEELNVRTYVYNEEGVPGVWFYSLDCNQPLAVWTARLLFHLPYYHARMQASPRAGAEGRLNYRSRRAGTTGDAIYRYQRTGEARDPAPGSLEFFLLERYYLYSVRGGRLFRGQVAHPPYRYTGAALEEFSALPAEQDGFPALCGLPYHVCAAERVDVRVHAIRPVVTEASPIPALGKGGNNLYGQVMK